MNKFTKTISIRWADLDPNFHLRHSVYYDFGSQQRIEILEEAGLTVQVMKEQHFGPVILREECVFKREIRFGDEITIKAKVASLSNDHSRWTIVHEFYNISGKICAVLTLDGAWFDTNLRRITNPTPQIAADVMLSFPRQGE